ncbi:putative secreted protein, partial [Operophtera brumata]
MERPELDIVVLGATGFTGVKVVKCLSEAVGLRWGIAGRSKDKLGKLIMDLHNTGNWVNSGCFKNKSRYPHYINAPIAGLDVSKVPVFNVDVNNKDALRKTTSQAKILMNCVGPSTIFSEQIVEACIESKTHYVDISAEINHILDLYRKYQRAAEDANVLIIPSCGFASVPAASGLLYLDGQFEVGLRSLNISGTLNTVECYVELDFPKRAYFPWPGNCLVHYGTWESLVYVLRNMKEKFFHRNNGKLWYPYPGPDEDVIEFSERYLHKNQNKRPVSFKLYTTMPLLIHFIIIPLMFMYYYLCYFKCFSKLLRKYPRFFTAGYMSHKGPSEKMMQAVTYSFTLIGKGWSSNVEDFSVPTNKTLKCK